MKKKKERSESEMESDIPQDILLEVLIRLPIKMVFQLTCVSKHWHSVITRPDFSDVYSFRNPSALVITVSNDDNSRHNFYYSILKHSGKDNDDSEPQEFVNSLCVKDAVRITETVNGMLCVCYNDSKNLRCLSLVNVRSGESIMELPHPGEGVRHRLAHYFLGFEPVLGVYKLLKIGKKTQYLHSNIVDSNMHDCEVLTLSRGGGGAADMKWRKVPESSDPVVFGRRCSNNDPSYLQKRSISVNGSLFWLLIEEINFVSSYPWSIVSFDFAQEKFRCIKPPKNSQNYFLNSKLNRIQREVDFV